MPSKNEWEEKRVEFILSRKAGKTVLSRNVARLGTRGRTDIRNPARLCRSHYLKGFLQEFGMLQDTKYSGG